MAAKTLAESLIEAHVSLIYTRAGLALAIAGGEPTVPQHQAAIVANAVRLNGLAELLPIPPLDLEAQILLEVNPQVASLQDVIDKYTLIRDNPEQAALMYLGTEGYDDPQPIIDSATAQRDAIVTARDAHILAGMPIPPMPETP